MFVLITFSFEKKKQMHLYAFVLLTICVFIDKAAVYSVVHKNQLYSSMSSNAENNAENNAYDTLQFSQSNNENPDETYNKLSKKQ